jgi:hypothetical protein
MQDMEDMFDAPALLDESAPAVLEEMFKWHKCRGLEPENLHVSVPPIDAQPPAP